MRSFFGIISPKVWKALFMWRLCDAFDIQKVTFPSLIVEDVGLFRDRGTFHHYACLRCLQPIEAPVGSSAKVELSKEDNESADVAAGESGAMGSTNSRSNAEVLPSYKVERDRKRSKLRMLSGCRHFICELCVKEGAHFTSQEKVHITHFPLPCVSLTLIQ